MEVTEDVTEEEIAGVTVEAGAAAGAAAAAVPVLPGDGHTSAVVAVAGVVVPARGAGAAVPEAVVDLLVEAALTVITGTAAANGSIATVMGRLAPLTITEVVTIATTVRLLLASVTVLLLARDLTEAFSKTLLLDHLQEDGGEEDEFVGMTGHPVSVFS